jgi:hypothetical protein
LASTRRTDFYRAEPSIADADTPAADDPNAPQRPTIGAAGQPAASRHHRSTSASRAPTCSDFEEPRNVPNVPIGGQQAEQMQIEQRKANLGAWGADTGGRTARETRHRVDDLEA